MRNSVEEVLYVTNYWTSIKVNLYAQHHAEPGESSYEQGGQSVSDLCPWQRLQRQNWSDWPTGFLPWARTTRRLQNSGCGKHTWGLFVDVSKARGTQTDIPRHTRPIESIQSNWNSNKSVRHGILFCWVDVFHWEGNMNRLRAEYRGAVSQTFWL